MPSVRCLITLWKDTNHLRYWRSVCHREPNEVRGDGLIPPHQSAYFEPSSAIASDPLFTS
jgi:hypothetical protein